MRRSVFLFTALPAVTLFATGCHNGNKGAADTVTAVVDSITADTATTDTLMEIAEEQEMPTAADELFDDFFFNFAASRKVQRERIAFPLTVKTYGDERQVSKAEWRRETFFMHQGYYTLILNSERQQSLAKDTAVSEATVERIDIPRASVTQWHFARKKGLWRMDGKATISLNAHHDAAFLRFYERFATEADYQQQHLAETVTFSGPDPDDDFSNITGEILPEQWPVFAPQELPHGVIYNIMYGKPAKDTNMRLFLVRGIANGLQTDLVFVRRKGTWRLTKCAV